MAESDPAAHAARDRLALALDVDDLVVATRLGRDLRPWFGVAKVGLELFSAAGPDAVGILADQGYDVFLDLKLYDIPTTVERASRVLGALGVRYLTVHAQGGLPVLRAAVDGLADGAARAGLDPPMTLGVTVLTSDDSAPPHILPKRTALAVEAGCGGVVCAASDLDEVGRIAPRLRRVVPGIRPEGAPTHDQRRAATPGEAIRRGADLLVVGRAVTAADDPRGAAEAVADEVAGAGSDGAPSR